MGKLNIGYEYSEELEKYFKDIEDIDVLTFEQEKEMAFKIKNGDKDALNKLVEHNLKFVILLAKSKRDKGVPFADLISEGNMALFRAARKFDPKYNVRFISYAKHWILEAFKKCIKTYNRYQEQIDNADYVINNYSDANYQHDTINEDFETKINDIQSRKETLDMLMNCLQEREFKIITLFYGMNDGREKTLSEVGKEMNLTNERVRQIKDNAISKLKCKALTYGDSNLELFMSLR